MLAKNAQVVQEDKVHPRTIYSMPCPLPTTLTIFSSTLFPWSQQADAGLPPCLTEVTAAQTMHRSGDNTESLLSQIQFEIPTHRGRMEVAESQEYENDYPSKEKFPGKLP